jgi:hypothetical protein
MTYKELMRELPDEITPEDAQKEYQLYLTEWWGSEVSCTTLTLRSLRLGTLHVQLLPQGRRPAS